MELNYQQKIPFGPSYNDKTSRAMVNRCWSFSTSLCCWNFCNWYCESSKYNNLYTLAANHRFCHEWSYFENIMKEMVAFFLSKGIVKGGELIIYLFIFCCDLFLLVCWCFCCDCCCCCLFVCFLCFLCFMLPPADFKQALHNKPPTHLGGNFSRIVIQPRSYSRNRDCGTSYN